MISIRLKDLVIDAQLLFRFISANRPAREALTFKDVMDHFSNELNLLTLQKREIFDRLKCKDQNDPDFRAEVKELLEAKVTHEHEPVHPESLSPISIDVLNALIRLGVVSG